MTKRQRRKTQALLEDLYAEYLSHHKEIIKLWKVSVNDLLAWNEGQITNPTEPDQDQTKEKS